MISTGGLSSRRAKLADQVADREPDRDSADHVQDEAPGRVDEREAPGDDRDDREAVGHERGAVVDQALALDQRDQPRAAARAAWRSTSRPSDRSARRARRARMTAGQSSPIASCATAATATIVISTSPIASSRDRAHVRAQLAQRGEERRAVEQRREDGDEHQLRPQLDLRAPGTKLSASRRARAGSGTGCGRTERPRGGSPARAAAQQEAVAGAEAQDRHGAEPSAARVSGRRWAAGASRSRAPAPGSAYRRCGTTRV